MRGRGATPRSEVTATRLVVSRVCGPVSLATPVPLDTETGDTLGLIAAEQHSLLHPLWFRREMGKVSRNGNVGKELKPVEDGTLILQ